MTDRPGSYLLFIDVDKTCAIDVGGLGRCQFRPGVYVYCGSALNGVKARVGRHFRSEKKAHWHIDRLLEVGELMFAILIYSDQRWECRMAEGLLRSGQFDRAIEDFGSSDCRCGGHLLYREELDTETVTLVQELLRSAS